MTDRKSLEEKLKKNIKRCLLLSKEDKSFWLDHLSILPETVLENVNKLIEEKNKIMDKYLDAAFKNDPNHKYLNELKSKIKKIKEKAFAIEEGTSKEKAEMEMQKQMENL